VIKENISEKEYYKLRLFQKDWPGLESQMLSERYYPLKESGSHNIGYLGAVNEKEFFKIAEKIFPSPPPVFLKQPSKRIGEIIRTCFYIEKSSSFIE